jgi:hypothetical protein
MYKLNEAQKREAAFARMNRNQLNLWHRRLGHLGYGNLKLLRDKTAVGIVFQDEGPPQYEDCLKGMQTKQPFKKTGAERPEEVLELVHSDVCEPMREASCSGFCYYLNTIIDDEIRKTIVYFLRHKGEVLSNVEQFKALVENHTGKTLKTLRTHNGREYVNKAMQNFLRRN